jgi:hypothetical protein
MKLGCKPSHTTTDSQIFPGSIGTVCEPDCEYCHKAPAIATSKTYSDRPYSLTAFARKNQARLYRSRQTAIHSAARSRRSGNLVERIAPKTAP